MISVSVVRRLMLEVRDSLDDLRLLMHTRSV